MNDLIAIIKEKAQLDDAITCRLRGFRLCASMEHEPDEITSDSFLLFIDLPLRSASQSFVTSSLEQAVLKTSSAPESDYPRRGRKACVCQG
jgi:hypothetical protein